MLTHVKCPPVPPDRFDRDPILTEYDVRGTTQHEHLLDAPSSRPSTSPPGQEVLSTLVGIPSRSDSKVIGRGARFQWPATRALFRPPRTRTRLGREYWTGRGVRVPSHRSFRILFVLRPDIHDAACIRYRAYNIIEALRLAGIEAAHLDDRQIPRRLADALSFDLIVIVRRPMTPEISILLHHAKRSSVPVVYDIDDYLFDEEVFPHVEAFREKSPDEMRRLVETRREVLVRCDAFTGTTAFLTKRAAALGIRSFQIRNGLNHAQLELSRRVLENGRRRAGKPSAPARLLQRHRYASGGFRPDRARAPPSAR